MKIEKVLCSVGLAGNYYEDLAAIRAGAVPDGLFYDAEPQSPGFASIRQRGTCLNLQLVLDDGSVARGDCLGVILSGSFDRDPRFLAEDHIRFVTDELAPRLEGVTLESFRKLAEDVDHLHVHGARLPRAITYGFSQALLGAVAAGQRVSMTEVLVNEYGLPVPDRPVPIFGVGASGIHREEKVDRMIYGRADVLPHGGFATASAVGPDGHALLDFVAWVSRRVRRRGGEGYSPVLHFDVYGALSDIAGDSQARMEAYIAALVAAASPFRVRLEAPVTGQDSASCLDAMKRLTRFVDAEGLELEIVADDYCNTLEDIKAWADARAAHMIQIKLPDLGSITNAVEAALYCQGRGIKTYIGGSMNDTDVSGCVTVHLGLALGADQIMAKPGPEPDVSLALTRNEMTRTLALLKWRRGRECRDPT